MAKARSSKVVAKKVGSKKVPPKIAKSKPIKKSPPAKKIVLKVVKLATGNTKADKKKPKAAAVPKKVSGKGAKGKKDDNLLELGLLCDCTSSMCSWIERAKKTLKEIITNVVSSCDGNLKVRVCFIGYRDHCDSVRFSIKDFTDDIDSVKNYIQGVSANGGGDFPEDVVGGLRKCLD